MNAENRTPGDALPAMGHIRAGRKSPAELAEELPDRLARSLILGCGHYSTPIMALGDRLTAPWLRRNPSPYRDEIFAIRDIAPSVGSIMLNMSFEWACTTCALSNGRGGNKMLRVLDWMLEGLGREAVVVTHETDLGPYHNVTWIGYVGSFTGMAPGRFSAAINQPPMRRTTNIRSIDWLIERKRIMSADAIPPHHLLRLAFETCPDFEGARKLIAETPICIPAFFTLSGATPEEAVCIERLETKAFIHDNPATFANHWISAPEGGYDRGTDSQGRYVLMNKARLESGDAPFSWIRPPILNETTRLAVVADASAGEMIVRAYDADGKGSAEPASRDFVLSERLAEAA